MTTSLNGDSNKSIQKIALITGITGQVSDRIESKIFFTILSKFFFAGWFVFS